MFSGIKVRATIRVHEYWGKKSRAVKDVQEIEGVFHAISIAVISCKCQKAKLGIAPNAAVDDGYLQVSSAISTNPPIVHLYFKTWLNNQVILVREGNRLRMIRFLLNVARGSKSLQQRSPHLKAHRGESRHGDDLAATKAIEQPAASSLQCAERDSNEDILPGSSETKLIEDNKRANDFDIIACRRVDIEVKKSMPWNVDGEVSHSKTISVECLNRAIHLYSGCS